MAVTVALLSILTHGLFEYRPAISWHIRIVMSKKLQIPSMPSTDMLVAELRAAARGRVVTSTRAYVGHLLRPAILALQEKVCSTASFRIYFLPT